MSGAGPAQLADRPGVGVASELVLVAQAVRASLAGCGFDATTLRWPGDHEEAAVRVSPPGTDLEVGLLISDLDSWSQLKAARLLIADLPLPWVVLTTITQGPMWGAVLQAGARVVLPSTTSFEDVCDVVVAVAHGAEDGHPDERELLTAQWSRPLARREEIGRRVGSLTPREHEVLTLLHAGEPVAQIAQLLGVSPATVRTQVKAVLRKLQVNSQLGAVAALEDLLELEPMELTQLQT